MNTIRFGICAQPYQIAQAAAAGYDYIELNLNRILGMSSEEYLAMAQQMKDNDIYAEVLSGMLPEGTRIVGDGVSARELHECLGKSFEAARALGAELVIFDCEKSRRLPEGFDPALSWRQLGNFIRMVQGYACEYGVRAALLPMRRSDVDLMNYVSEATLISAMLRLDQVGVAASAYHMAMESEALSSLKRTGSLLWHMRISNVLKRRLPAAGDGENYRQMFSALRDAGYTGRVSLEGDAADFRIDAPAALKCVRQSCRIFYAV